ncbi:MAG: hypothetical protein JO316_03520 [Abitibacteriaceae bacterium]|nr:hypothetical protein [Abditibacteriaceae bacterium]MBV9864390.1 hypothetical protein [Abditibacteriaceae bacterium]
MASTFHLKQNETLLGVLHQDGGDFPWFDARFEPTPAFEEYQPLFARELELLEAEEWEEWDKVYLQFQQSGIYLFDVAEAIRIDEFILHIKGDEAWFRYNIK